jgi:hypothetical protein
MSNNQSNYFLFYSKGFCDFSKRCVDRLTKSGIIGSVVLCNIDDPKLMIPPFITTVPTLFIANDRKVLTDTQLFEWIEQNNMNTRQGNNTMSMADITGDANIFAYQQNEMSGTGGGAYAFLDDNQNDALPSTYEFLDGSNKDRLVMPSFTKMTDAPVDFTSVNVKDDRKQQKDELSMAYEKLLADRNADMGGIKRV